MLELLTAAEMGLADKLAVEAGVPGIDLMERAGAAVAEAVQRLMPDGRRVAVLAGPGNNGGDAFVAARRLDDRGYDIRLGLLGNPKRLPPDAAAAAQAWEGRVLPLDAELLDGADIVIDGIFGAGLARPIEGAAAELIGTLNRSGLPVVAIDVPSGIDGTTGEVKGIAIRATETVTFFRRKPGHLLLPGQLYCGPVTLADIGIPDEVLDSIRPKTFADEPGLWLARFPWPRPGGHKYLRGHAVVVSGPEDATGAARMAARGALRVGAGLVTVASPSGALLVNASQLTAVMVRPVDDASGLAELLSDTRKNAVVLGPGLGVGEHAAELVQAALASSAAAVIDADGLTSFADNPARLFDIVKERSAPTVFTPHEGEFARLFGDIVRSGGSKLDHARAAAERSGAIVVLKGSDTVIATPDGRAAINTTATPFLATAGTGDVLAGMTGGMLAQALASKTMAPFEAVAAAVWLHGAAGEAFGPGLIAEDLPEMLPGVFRGLLGQAPSSSR